MKLLFSLSSAVIGLATFAFPVVAQHMPERACRGVYSRGWCITEDNETTYAFTWTRDNYEFGYGVRTYPDGVEYHTVIATLIGSQRPILLAGKEYNTSNYQFDAGDFDTLMDFASEGLYAEGLIQGYLAND